MGSSPRLLDLRVMYCKDLKAFNFFQKLSVYAVVSLVSDNPSMMKKQQQQQRTPTDTEGDGNPEWNHQMRFNLGLEGDYDGDGDDDDHHLIKKNHHHFFLHFDMRTELAIFGDKSVGEVRVPLKDVINREEEEVESSDGIIRFVSYEVRTSDGKPNGVLSFSYKVLNECNGSSSLEKKKKNAHIDSYPILNHINHHHNHFHYPSLLPDDYLQIPSGSGSGQSQESYYSATAVDAPPPHRVHYPSLEIPYPPPAAAAAAAAAAEEDYRMNYPQPHDQLHFHYPPPPPPPPPLMSRPPFPPPHLHLPLPPHAVQGSIVYYPQLYEHPYPD
ncbi:hypothetical protein LOK49_LG04G03461 [Camellia lanceoleosa]|uniref:Uncharacterized protein n=1 Tax=Camellia lanceoleosa TaxID=1840588 RepID=A0ACC0I4R5_9ERIC|nr:hypothetical protein LOK49_LG04G03461 [Camellia lanceoleosa]